MSNDDYIMSKTFLQSINLNIDYFSFNGLRCYSRVIDVYDGDTVTVILSYNSQPIKLRIRLVGINSAEIKSKDIDNALNSRNHLLYLITSDERARQCSSRKDVKSLLQEQCFLVWLECEKMDKYGRVLAKIYKDRSDNNLSDQMLEGGFAVTY